MRKKKQNGLASKYWLLILSAVCLLLMGISLISDKINGPLRIFANYTDCSDAERNQSNRNVLTDITVILRHCS